MNKVEYREALKDPRWQKKRLEVLKNGGWECAACGDKKSQLQVHHRRYEGDMPWETPNEFLEVLCSECHEERRTIEKHLNRLIKTTSTAQIARIHGSLSRIYEAIRSEDNLSDDLKSRDFREWAMMQILTAVISDKARQYRK